MRIVIATAHRVFAEALTSLLKKSGHDIVGCATELDAAARIIEREQVECSPNYVRLRDRRIRRSEVPFAREELGGTPLADAEFRLPSCRLYGAHSLAPDLPDTVDGSAITSCDQPLSFLTDRIA